MWAGLKIPVPWLYGSTGALLLDAAGPWAVLYVEGLPSEIVVTLRPPIIQEAMYSKNMQHLLTLYSQSGPRKAETDLLEPWPAQMIVPKYAFSSAFV